MLEGTPTRNRGVASAELTRHPAHIMAVGTTIVLSTNGRRPYTLDKQFARGRVLRA